MPVHDWTLVEPGIFHDFHQSWIVAIRNALNTGGLPPGYFALAEQVLSGPIPDVIALHRPRQSDDSEVGGVALAEAPVQTSVQCFAEEDIYAAKADRIAIHHSLGEVVAVIEIVSPGNKNSRHALRSFVQKALELLNQGIHLLLVDLFPPSTRDPQGIHKAIWDEIADDPFELPADKRLTLAAYLAGRRKGAFVEPLAVGQAMPAMPIFLSTETYVPAPLEATYQATWAVCPEPIRELLERPKQ